MSIFAWKSDVAWLCVYSGDCLVRKFFWMTNFSCIKNFSIEILLVTKHKWHILNLFHILKRWKSTLFFFYPCKNKICRQDRFLIFSLKYTKVRSMGGGEILPKIYYFLISSYLESQLERLKHYFPHMKESNFLIMTQTCVSWIVNIFSNNLLNILII